MSKVTRSSPSRILLGIAAIGLSTPLAGVGQTREIAFASSSAGVTLTGTITGPTAPTALAVLVSVAGPTDRDLTLGRHKYFERLADGLAEGGVATLRYDDRGVGGSGGSLGTTDLSTRAADACEALGALRSRYVGIDRVGVVGMSEGGGIALLASERCGPLSFAVLLSAPVRDGQTVMKGQVKRLLAAGSIPDERKAEIEAEALRFLDLVAADQPEDNRGEILELLRGPYGNTILPPYAFVPQGPEARTDFVLSPWYQSQVRYDVQSAVRGASVPIFAIYGELDQAIEPEANATLLRELAHGAEVVVLPRLNHLMQEARTGSPLEYAMLPESMSIDVVGRVLAYVGGGSSDLPAKFMERVEELRGELIEVRRDLHRHPELSGQEERTARIVADRLRAAGFDVRAGVGGHGVVGLLRGAAPGPVLAFRADMDAVRSGAPDPVAFRSEVAGVRHICGHDIHTTIGLALAEGFAAVRDELPGSVLLIFQPAEESATGAQAMLADGAFVDPIPEAVFAFHTAPFEVGQIATASHTLMPGRDAVQVKIDGEGDLESVAQQVRDLVLATGTLAVGEATRPAVGSFVLAQGGRVAREGPAGGWTAAATLTTSSREASAEARRAIELGLAELARDGLSLRLDYRERFIAGVTNEPGLVEAANLSARRVLGDEAVVMLQSMTPAFSEDFGSFQEDVPGVMYFLGVSNAERGWVGIPHSPNYVADEEAIFVGARTMAAVFFDLFENGVPDGAR